MKEKRADFLAKMQGVDVRRVLFLDEFGFNLGFCRLWGWAKQGERAYGSAPENTDPHVTLVVALRYAGALAPFTFDGAMDGLAYQTYLEKALGPHLRPDTVVVFDNLGSHRSGLALDFLRRRGVRAIPLPPYSPDFTPVEECGSKIKQVVRGLEPRTRQDVDAAIGKAFGRVTAKDARGWFRDRAFYFFPIRPKPARKGHRPRTRRGSGHTPTGPPL